MSNGPTITLPANMLPSFFADLRLLADPANHNLVQKASEVLGVYLGAVSEAGQMRLEAELAASVPTDQVTVRRVIQMLGVLSNTLAVEAEGTDSTQAAAKVVEILQRTAGDKKELHLSTEELSRLQTLFGTMAEESGRVKQDAEVQGIIKGVLPMFEDLKATMELRVLQWPLTSGIADAEQTFKFVPIASLSLKLDSGDPSVLCFQATEADLASILDKLQRLQSALVNLKQAAVTFSSEVDA